MEQTNCTEHPDELTPRPVADSVSEMVQYVLPNDTNPMGVLLGGQLMHWIDLAGALAAFRHARKDVVTASTDHLDFLFPAHVGDLVVLRASVNRTFRTSMEVGVKVWVECVYTGQRHHVSSAYLTFVAVDRKGGKLPVAPAIPESDEEKRRHEDAGRRRQMRRVEAARKAGVTSHGRTPSAER